MNSKVEELSSTAKELNTDNSSRNAIGNVNSHARLFAN